ncbi:hypothetical protein AX17_004536 [Amanita inopinata Kibby_2008]|nr:hypothetical protein AX17_004536 [Amanita inopinata Kibby_2008]
MATPFTEAWLQGPQDTQFYTRTYTPQTKTPTAAVIFVHGFSDHVARYAQFHLNLAEHGIVVFAFDQRGFGKTAMDKEGHKSPSSSYGKTNWGDQLADIVWALDQIKQKHPSLPVFLIGASMGGGEALGFATQTKESPHYASVASLSGIIALSPLILLTKPAAKPLRVIGGFMSKIFPNAPFPADVDPQALSHDSAVAEEYMKDPMTRPQGTLRGLNDMIIQGEQLLEAKYANWPEELPVLFCHGTDDQITSFAATESFHGKINARYKKLATFQDGYHELLNEPGGVHEKLIEEVVTFITAYTPASEDATKARM